jgi:hypothetical protein
MILGLEAALACVAQNKLTAKMTTARVNRDWCFMEQPKDEEGSRWIQGVSSLKNT